MSPLKRSSSQNVTPLSLKKSATSKPPKPLKSSLKKLPTLKKSPTKKLVKKPSKKFIKPTSILEDIKSYKSSSIVSERISTPEDKMSASTLRRSHRSKKSVQLESGSIIIFQGDGPAQSQNELKLQDLNEMEQIRSAEQSI